MRLLITRAARGVTRVDHSVSSPTTRLNPISSDYPISRISVFDALLVQRYSSQNRQKISGGRWHASDVGVAEGHFVGVVPCFPSLLGVVPYFPGLLAVAPYFPSLLRVSPYILFAHLRSPP